ncbi:MAG TPA: AbrB/MazE/SpoVT family DNA-binding domain-containing protein, partial [Gammaproteobacteria bacterium]|nr:AbrB/MazE/SpoVT family DNA-binding domain-containing protein [Gammaproteobacteria bacterium]
MPTATLSSRSQLVLPAEIRRKLGIRPGDRVVIELEG